MRASFFYRNDCKIRDVPNSYRKELAFCKERLKMGQEGILKRFKAAEKAWG